MDLSYTLISLCLAPNLISGSNISCLLDCPIYFVCIFIKMIEGNDLEGEDILKPTSKDGPNTQCRFSYCKKQDLIL